ncbi:MAG: DEAD/DEAH box helicase [Bacteroidia bacterium]|nr:DEAD/DEAH box helicase [Bacteroidia bacterium]
MGQKFIVAVSEHRLFGYLILPYLADEDAGSKYLSITKRLRAHDLLDLGNAFTVPQIELVRLTEKYADENLAKKYNPKGTLNDFYKNIKSEIFTKKLLPFIDEVMAQCLELLKNDHIPVYFKRAKYNNIYEDDLIELCYEDTKAVYNFHKLDQETRYFLTIRNGQKQISLLHQSMVILVNEPCRVLYNNKLYFFDDISGTKMSPFFEKEYISIPRSVEVKYYNSFILNAIKNHEISYSGFEIVDGSARKEVILSVEIDSQGFPVFIPLFKYNDQLIPAGDEGTKIAAFSVYQDSYLFNRSEKDTVWEAQVISDLQNIGLSGSLPALYLANLEESKMQTIYNAVNWISKNSKALNRLGIEVIQDKLDHVYFIGNQSIELAIDHQNDWFDVNAMVVFGSFKIPFVRLRKNILGHIREFKLPDGSVAILPVEWFTKYQAIFSYGKVGDNTIRLQNYHYMLVDEVVEGSVTKRNDELLRSAKSPIVRQDKPIGLIASLRSYQQDGFDWLSHLHKNNLGGCLADDMGLGKTIQALALLLKFKKESTDFDIPFQPETGQLSLFGAEGTGQEKPQPASLIVLPVSLVHNWEREIQKFAPSLRTYVYSGARRREKNVLNQLLLNFDLVLTTYGTVRNDADKLAQYEFFYLILDESQTIKNSESKTYKSIMSIRSQHRIVLTGTPIENSLSDLWAQMNFLNRGLLGSKNHFKETFILPIERDNLPEPREHLHKLIAPFMLRRTKEQVAKDLPSLTEETILVEMPAEQLALYETEKSAIRNALLENYQPDGLTQSAFYVLQALTRLRQIAIHPKLIDRTFEFESGKFNEIISMLSILVAENHKILVFSSFVKSLKLFAAEFTRQHWEYSILTGQTDDRKEVIDDFQGDVNKKIFLISLKAGGVGLNLTAADYIFITDPWWNPAAEMQAISRAHRIGQDKKVFVYRFIAENSIEQKIQKLQERKSKLANEFVLANDPLKSISSAEVLELFD